MTLEDIVSEMSYSILPSKQQNAHVTSIPKCWDTRRAGTNEGYFDFQHFAFCAHVRNLKKIVLFLY